MRHTLVIALGLLVAACGGGEYQDLREELKQLGAGMRGKVAPLPVVKPYEPVPYNAFHLPDPFGSGKIELGVKTATASGGGIKPDLNRPKEPLEAFPLESLKVVGMIEQGKQVQALVLAGASVYRVGLGNYMGQNFGRITSVTETQVKLRELVQDALGDWIERASTLQLQEAGGNQ